MQLPRGQSGTLKQRPGFKRECLVEAAAIEQFMNDRQRGAPGDGGETTGVTDRHRPDGSIAHQFEHQVGAFATLRDRGSQLLGPDGVRLVEHGVGAVRNPCRNAVDHTGQVDRRRARRPKRRNGCGLFTSRKRADREGHSVCPGDADRRGTPHRQPLDGVDHRRNITYREHLVAVGKQGLLDQLDSSRIPLDCRALPLPMHSREVMPYAWGHNLTGMENRWDVAAAPSGDLLGECVYCTRLIGADPNLVLHGGGNSSVKVMWTDITGRIIPALRVKGSGWDMGSIEGPGFTPLALERLHELLSLNKLSDPEMMRELSAARLDPSSPQPSVESLLHAHLPHRAVQHSHADVIVQLTNLADGEAVVRKVLGGRVVVVPYVMPGFDLARAVRELWPDQASDDTMGMVLLNHGLFTFGDSSRDAYDRHVELITTAESWLAAQLGPERAAPGPLPEVLLTDLADLRLAMSKAAGVPLITRRSTDEAVRRFVSRGDLSSVSQRGPLTPDHVIRTKRVPMIGRNVAAYGATYAEYFERNRQRGRMPLTMLDTAPRVVLDPEFGMITAGRTAKDAAIAADIYQHTMPVIEGSEDHLGGYVALPEGDLFDCEYWDLEQAKLRISGPPPAFAGMVGLVTGAGSGIGKACADELKRRGAAVVGVDLRGADVAIDVTDPEAQASALRTAVESYGGLDVLVVAAGIFGATIPIAEMTMVEWRKVLSVNLDAIADLLQQAHPLLARSPVGGRVVLIGSKNVAAPGKGAAAYSASKAALTQLARVAALEWAADRIRINVVHPDAVFDTGLWTPELLAERAAKYDMSVDEYKRRNLLSTEVTSAGVARVVTELCSDTFSATTGAQIPIDGGNDRVI